MIDGPICHQPRALAEVRRPASQYAIEPMTNVLPGLHVAGFQHLSDLLPDPGNTLLGRSRPQIPVAIFPVTIRPARIPQKVKPLLPCLPDAGLRFVQSESNPRHHLPRPI